MIQLAGIHNGFRNKNYLDNIDIADIGNMDNNMGMKAAGEHTEAAGEHIEAAGEHTEAAGNRQLVEVQQHWSGSFRIYSFYNYIIIYLYKFSILSIIANIYFS